MIEKEFNITCSQSLSKNLTVTTEDYKSEFDPEYGCDVLDTSDTNWDEEYKGNHHFTPLQLIQKYKEFLEEEIVEIEEKLKKKPSPIRRVKKYVLMHMINECEGWIEDETVICED